MKIKKILIQCGMLSLLSTTILADTNNTAPDRNGVYLNFGGGIKFFSNKFKLVSEKGTKDFSSKVAPMFFGGIGYSFSNRFAAELNYTYYDLPLKKFSLSKNKQEDIDNFLRVTGIDSQNEDGNKLKSQQFKFTSHAIIISGRYNWNNEDFGPIKLSSKLGIGINFMNFSSNTKLSNPNDNSTAITEINMQGKNAVGFAATVDNIASIPLSDNVDLDLGLQVAFLGKPSDKIKSVKIKGNNLDSESTKKLQEVIKTGYNEAPEIKFKNRTVAMSVLLGLRVHL
ncbi:hypothetical protein [Rickettsia endosymbiont of Cardiosporidium cionae]|uniref:hypothetical protein n=1 Tax=Rickettsia endosymbiont of Cardiosporidium cionae TaxID=2777155 RepID=UPI001896263D|nr:hypothetical protein [Rickettsia endosymbiont of Cardiosporidium cionae]KAF8818971.1 hypothetical protein IHI24_000206 [Rickettsia endosymbiont of Cardiosporidium cionae]